jgi:hypothetical protein
MMWPINKVLLVHYVQERQNADAENTCITATSRVLLALQTRWAF